MQGPTAPWDPPCRDNTAPAPSCWPRALPSLTPKQEHTREHTGGLCHTELCWEQLWPKEKKGGEGQRHEGEGGGERRGPSHLCVSPPCPPPTLPPVGAGALQTRSSPVPGLWDTAAQTPGPGAAPAPTARPLPGRNTSTGASLSERVRLRLSQPPSCSTSSTEGGRLPGTSPERGPSAPARARALTARGGPGLDVRKLPRPPQPQRCARSAGDIGPGHSATKLPITPLSPHPCPLWVLTEHHRPIPGTQRPVLCAQYCGCALTRTPVVFSLVQGELMAWKALPE